ncbi:A24 family peptidase [Brevibacillus dissolubilis]|uniref:A24 family peptidase n=1 Tax=Brevibacillus dissolubilis TaxID=1844116 RepID=UPI00111775A2|nr:prepilin peptidase [Brevibacillus dissolubilis]
MTLTSIVLIVFFLVVFFYDLLYQVIPNSLTIGTTLVGWALAYYTGDGQITYSILNTLFGFAILLIPYILGWVGGGDVKMLMALGSLSTITFLTHVAIGGIMLAGLLSLIFLFIRGRSRLVLQSFLYAMTNRVGQTQFTHTFIPLGSCISLAGLFLILLQYMGVIYV